MSSLELPTEYVNILLWNGYVEEASRLSEYTDYDKSRIEEFVQSKRKLTSNVTNGFNVYVDTTTVSTASQIVFHRKIPNAFTFFDLGILTGALVLFDHVYLPYGPSATAYADPINEELGERVVECLEFHGVGGEIPYNIAANIFNTLDEEKLRDELLSEWKKVFGEKIPDSVSFSKVHMVSPPSFSYFLSSLEGLDKDVDVDNLSDFVSGSTFRTFFNHEMSRVVELPYLPNSSRGVIESKIYQMIGRQLPQIDLFLKIVKRKIELELESVKPEVMFQTGLPLLTSVVLQRMKNIKDYFKVVIELRAKSKKYRRKIGKIVEATAKGDIKSVASTIKILKGEYGRVFDFLKKIGKGAGQTALCITPNISPLSEDTLNVLKAAKYLITTTNDVGLIRRFYTRLFKPHVWFIEDVGSSARRMLSVDHGFERIWKTTLNVEHKRLLEKIATNYPYNGLSSISS